MKCYSETWRGFYLNFYRSCFGEKTPSKKSCSEYTEHLYDQYTEHLYDQYTEHLYDQYTEHLYDQYTEHLYDQKYIQTIVMRIDK